MRVAKQALLSSSALRTMVVCTPVLWAVFGSSAAGDLTSQHDFNLPAENALNSIPEFAHQADVQILVSESDVDSKRTRAINGRYTVSSGLEKLLAGTSIVVASNSNGTITLHQAADAPAGGVLSAGNQAAQEMETVIVTGSSNLLGERKLDASFSITTASESQIREAAPSSTADLLKIVPGVFVESTGGVSGANVEVRGFPTGGDAPFASIALNGSPLYASPTLSFLDNSSLFRLDDTVARVEVLRGGPSPIWSSGQPGVTVNFIEKNGETNPGGSLRLSWDNGDQRRIDLYYGGKIAEGWYASVGGFYRTSDGIRDTQFPSDDGYQAEVTLVHDIDNGKITFHGRVTKDNNAFFTPIPLLSEDNGHKVKAFPGFDPMTGTLLGNANRVVTFETTPGTTPGTMTMDMADGRGLSTHMFGVELEKTYGGWEVSNKLNFNEGEAYCHCLFTGANPETLGSYVSSAVSTANANPAIVTAAGGMATAGTATFAGNGAAITDPQTEVIDAGMWYVNKKIKSFTDDARLNRELFQGNSLALGLYFADYSSNDIWQLGNSMLMTLQNNARPINVSLNNGVIVSKNGIDGPATYALNAHYNGRNIAGTIADTWQATDKLRIDVGVRIENQTVDATIENDSALDLDNNILTLYDNGASVPNGSYSDIHHTSVASSWTAGIDYSIMDNLNAFARVNQGYLFPQFDDFRSGVSTTQHIDQYELGVKTVSTIYSVFLTGYYNKFWGQPQQQILSDGSQVNYILSSRAFGLEFEAEVRPFEGLQLSLTGDYNDAQYVKSPVYSGNTVLRQPKVQLRFTPSYTLPIPMLEDSSYAKVYATYAYVGERWADVQNQQYLPAYNTVDIGAVLAINETYEIDFTGTNVFNELGITEGNTRVLGTGTGAGGVFLGRPLFGATYQLSGVIHF